MATFSSEASSLDLNLRDTWGSGLVADLTLTPTRALNGWTVTFDYPGDIVNIWNAKIVSHVGDRYLVEAMGYNANVPADGSVNFGFQGSGSVHEITPVALADEPIGGGDDASPRPVVSVFDAAASEEDGSIAFAVSLSTPSNTDVTISYQTVAGSAEAGVDYAATTATVTIPAGQTSAMITLPLTNDVNPEAREAFSLQLVAADGADIGNATATGTITDTDSALPIPIEVTVTGGSVTEADPGMDHMHGDGSSHMHDDGHRNLTFMVSLAAPATEEVTLSYTTSDGTAVADTTSDVAWDYHTASGSVVFAVGEQTKMITVSVHPDTLVEEIETLTLTVSGDNITGTLSATGYIYDNDSDPADDGMDGGPGDHGGSGDDVVAGGGHGSTGFVGGGTTYAVGDVQVVRDFDPARDVLDLGGASIHNQIPVDTAQGFMMLNMFNASQSLLVEGVWLKDLHPENFVPISDAHLQQDLSAVLAYEDGSGFVRPNTVYIRSHQEGLVETVDFDPATDKISFFYLSVRGDGKLNFAVEDTAQGARFFNPLTGQSLTLNGVFFADLDSSHFEWRANQLEDNVAGRMGLTEVIDGFQIVSENVFSGKSVAMAGGVDRAPYHSVHGYDDYSGAPIGDGTNTGSTGDDPGDQAVTAPVNVTVTGGSVTEADPGMDHMHDDGTSHMHDDGHRYITFQIALDAPATDVLTLNYATSDGTAVADTTSDVAWDYHTANGTVTFEVGEQLKTVVVAVHPDELVEETETYSFSVSGDNITGTLQATGTIYDDDTADDGMGDGDAGDGMDHGSGGDAGDDTGGDGSQGAGAFIGGGTSYSVGNQAVITGFDPTRDVLDLGGDSIHNQIPVDTADGFMMLHMFNASKSTLVEGVFLADLFPESFAPISDSHLQQDLSAALAWEDGSGLVRPNTVYIRSHEEGLPQIVDFDPATDKISFFYLSVRGDGELNFSVEQTDAGVRFYSPLTGQSMTLRDTTFDDLTSDHFEWRANQLEDNVASRMNLSGQIDGFRVVNENVFGGKSVAMAGLVDRAPYHSQPEYTGTPIGQVGDPSNPDIVVPDPVDDDTGGGSGETGGDAAGSPATPGVVEPEIASSWGTGYNVEVSFTPASAVNGWTVQLRLNGDIANIWNADISAQDGDVYTLVSKDYNSALSAGQTTGFGFQVSGGPAFVEVLGLDDMLDDPVDDPVDDPMDDPVGDPMDDPVDDPTDDPVDDPADDPVDPVVPAPSGGDVLNGPLSTQGTEIVDADGKKVDLKGVNWFGFETDLGVLHGLWARNMEEMLDEIAGYGFNIIRLPFAGELALNDRAPGSINYAENPELNGLSSHEILTRFLDAAADRGLGVLLDMHRTTPGNGPEAGGIIPDEQAFLDQWAAMAEKFGDHEAVIGFDLYNEPHGYSWGGWASIAETAGNMLLASNPDELIIVEGVETYQGDSHWWGGNLQGVADRPVVLNAADKLVYSPHEYATSVFDQPYFSAPGFDPVSDLPEIFRENWGFIEEEGIAPVLLGEFGSTFVNATDQAWGPVLADYLLEQDIDWAFWAWNPNSGDTGGVVEGDWETPRAAAFTYLLDELFAEGADGSDTPNDGPVDDPVDEPVGDPVDEPVDDPVEDPTPPEDPALLAVSGQTVTEGDSGETDVTFAVTLSEAKSHEVTVDYATSDGTASAGSDYTAASGTLTFAPGETSKTVTVQILGDTEVEENEGINLTLSNAIGDAEVATAQASATITNDDTPPEPEPVDTAATASFAVRQSWNGGFVGDLTITNEGDSALTDWELSFDGDFTIGDIWGAAIAQQGNGSYTLISSGWTESIAPGQSVTFGFVGRGGSGPESLTGLSLNGAGDEAPGLPDTPDTPLASMDQDVEATLYHVDEIKSGSFEASPNSDFAEITSDTVLVQSNDFGQAGYDGHNWGGINPNMYRGFDYAGREREIGESIGTGPTIQVDNTMTTQEIEDAINAAPIGATVEFQAGVYQLTETINVSRGDIHIKGVSEDDVVLRADAITSDAVFRVKEGSINGKLGENEADLITDTIEAVQAEDKVVTLLSVDGIEAGDFLEFVYNYTNEVNSRVFNGSGGSFDKISSLVEVASVKATTNEVTLREKVGMDYDPNRDIGNTEVRVFDGDAFIHNLIISDLTIKYMDDDDYADIVDPHDLFNYNNSNYGGAYDHKVSGIRLEAVHESDILNITIENAGSMGIWIDAGYQVGVRDFTFDGSQNLGGGGNGYGMLLDDSFYGDFEGLTIGSVDEDGQIAATRHAVVMGYSSSAAFSNIHYAFANSNLDHHGGLDFGNISYVETMAMTHTDHYNFGVMDDRYVLDGLHYNQIQNTYVFDDVLTQNNGPIPNYVGSLVPGQEDGQGPWANNGIGSSTVDRVFMSANGGSARTYGDDDEIHSGVGNDEFWGGDGDDTFVIYDRNGSDIVHDFESGDRIALHQGINSTRVETGAAALARVSQLGSDALLDLGDGNTLTLAEVQVSDLNEDDFVFF